MRILAIGGVLVVVIFYVRFFLALMADGNPRSRRLAIGNWLRFHRKPARSPGKLIEMRPLPPRTGTKPFPRRFRHLALLVGAVILCTVACHAQETVFNVPSADVLDKGKVYGEVDIPIAFQQSTSSFEPRVVVGVGKRVEVGANVIGLSAPDIGQVTVSPTIKWMPYKGANGWSLFLGDNIFFPVRQRQYTAGNYVYASVSKAFLEGTRVSAGGYEFTAHVVAPGRRTGVQATFEQTVTKSLTFAADWFSGAHASGYLTPGIVMKPTSRLTFYGGYELGNSGLTQGNHALLIELGYNFN